MELTKLNRVTATLCNVVFVHNQIIKGELTPSLGFDEWYIDLPEVYSYFIALNMREMHMVRRNGGVWYCRMQAKYNYDNWYVGEDTDYDKAIVQAIAKFVEKNHGVQSYD